MRSFPALALLALALAAPVLATPPLGVDDVLGTRNFSELTISPDGRWAVYLLERPDEKQDRRLGELWRIDLEEEDAEPLRLTAEGVHSHAPCWSPDSRWIAFLSQRGEKDAKDQIWRIRPDGGEAEQLGEWKPGVEALRWAGDGRILFRAGESPTLRDRRREEKKDDARIVEDVDHFPPKRLFALDPEDETILRLTDNEDQITGFWLRPDGGAVVTRSVTVPWHRSAPEGARPVYRLWDLREGGFREILEDPLFDPDRVEWTADGQRLLAQWTFSRSHSEKLRTGAGTETLWEIDPTTGVRSPIDLGSELGLSGRVRGDVWLVIEGGVLALLADRVHVQPLRLERRGERWRARPMRATHGANLLAWTADPGGRRVVYLRSEADRPEQLWTARLAGDRLRDERLRHDPNEELAGRLGRSEPIAWTSSRDDEKITGILTWPRPYEEGRRYPLMVWIHGGPTGVDADAFENYWASFPHLLAARGMFVLQPNYRGGIDHGQDHVEAILHGKYYELEIPDILSGIDHCIDRGWAHPDSLGTTGWSNGAILSIQLTVESDRFRVCCAGAGDVNWSSDYGNCAFGANFEHSYLGAAPWEDPQLYIDKSPLFAMDRVRTPTLIQFGSQDVNVPTEQGWEHYRALQVLGKAPVRFLLYPGEGHGLRKLAHQRRKIEEELAWIDRWLLGREPRAEELVKEGSPLDLALTRERLRASDRVLGVEEGGLLLPRMAPEPVGEGIDARLSVCEITRAQFAEYLQWHPEQATGELLGWDAREAHFELGSEDLPVSGVSLDQARGYCRWLGEQTGRAYRLPRVEELRAAQKAVGKRAQGNNLCHWAGYAPTPDEAAGLRRRVADAQILGDLLLPVATTDGEGSLALFDLHGNVAEWAEESDGAVPVGPCVLDACDPAETPMDDPPRVLRGFRVALQD